jgi:uncharacterized damage-inducible protein DinB
VQEALSEILLIDLDHEMAGARKTLERVPVDKPDWKPHEKSMPLGRLARHVGDIPSWIAEAIGRDSLDISPPGAPPFQQSPPAKSQQELLDIFDKRLAAARAALAGASHEHLQKPWTLLFGGKTIFSLPRTVLLRTTVMSHTIHHRAQLGVYLRLNAVPVPALYGPSADEGGM